MCNTLEGSQDNITGAHVTPDFSSLKLPLARVNPFPSEIPVTAVKKHAGPSMFASPAGSARTRSNSADNVIFGPECDLQSLTQSTATRDV